MPLFVAAAGYIDEEIVAPDLPCVSGKCFRVRELSWIDEYEKTPQHIAYFDPSEFPAIDARGRVLSTYKHESGLPINPIKQTYVTKGSQRTIHDSCEFIADLQRVFALSSHIIYSGPEPDIDIKTKVKNVCVISCDFKESCGFHDFDLDCLCTRNKVLTLRKGWRRGVQERSRHAQRKHQVKKGRSRARERSPIRNSNKTKPRDRTPLRYVPGEKVNFDADAVSLVVPDG